MVKVDFTELGGGEMRKMVGEIKGSNDLSTDEIAHLITVKFSLDSGLMLLGRTIAPNTKTWVVV
jgi:hypothetical protein